MRIGLDYTPALRQHAGVGRYTRELTRAIVLEAVPHEVLLVVSRDAPVVSAPNQGIYQQTFCRLPLTERWQQIVWHRLHIPLSVERWTGPLHLYHSMDFTLPPLTGARGIVTIHDLAFLQVPECAEPGLRRYLSKAVPRSVERAEHVLADSEATRQDLIQWLDLPPHKVSVAYCGVDARFHVPVSETERERIRRKLNLTAPYILSVCTIEPRKNHRGLIAAYARLRRRSNLPHHLVLAGARGWLSEAIYSAPAEFDVADSVHFLGKVDDEDLPALYAEADLFAFPSLYEGFGLPPIEAMASGTPVVASDIATFREIIGGAGVLAKAGDTDALADALESVLSDDDLRSALKEKGAARAARFDWRSTAQTVLRTYQRVMEN